jgi:hypothetical protein
MGPLPIIAGMTELLDKAFRVAQSLPAAQQDAIARELLARLAAQPTGQPTGMPRKPDLQRIRAIAARCSKRPVIDPRSADEIIGYDEFGVPR